MVELLEVHTPGWKVLKRQLATAGVSVKKSFVDFY